MMDMRLTIAKALVCISLGLSAAASGAAHAAEAPSPGADNAAPAAGAAPSPEGAVRWTLDDVVRIALAKHPLVGQADAETRAAAARKGQSESGYYPSVNLATGYSRSRIFSSLIRKSFTTNTDSLQGTVSQLVTDFGRTGAGVRQADALLAATRETGRAVRSDVAFSAKVAFFNVLRARKILDVRRETVRQRESLLRQATAFYEAGIRARIDVARAEANLYQARADLTSAENDLRVGRIDLLNRMGIDAPAGYELAESPELESLPGTTGDWIREAEGARPELRALIERERAAESALRAARAGYAPVVTAGGGYGYAAEDFPFRQNYLLSLTMSVPVFSGFLTREQVAEAEAQRASAAYAVSDFRRQVRIQVERAALGIREAADRYEARRKENEASAENLRLATARYEVGAGDIIEMIDAQAQMTRSDTDTIDARYDQSIAVATLLRAIGR